MDQQQSVGTVDRPVDMTIGPTGGAESIAEAATFGEDEQPRDRTAEPSALWPSSLLDDAESVIQRYPWPTLLLGIGAGYLLARQVR